MCFIYTTESGQPYQSLPIKQNFYYIEITKLGKYEILKD